MCEQSNDPFEVIPSWLKLQKVFGYQYLFEHPIVRRKSDSKWFRIESYYTKSGDDTIRFSMAHDKGVERVSGISLENVLEQFEPILSNCSQRDT
jgi:hypothetical protein